MVFPSTLGGCLDDLPAPTTCPAGAQSASADCLGTIQQVFASPEPRCFTVSEMRCLSGDRPCTCLSDECPVPDDACYPPPDCPAKVREEAAPDASCVRLAPAQIGAGFPSEYQCLCGCSGCAAVCDGRGPVLGVLDDGFMGEFDFIPPIFEIGDEMPDSGALGVYLRVRGLANTSLLVLRGDLGAPELLQQHLILTPLTPDFVEHVVYDQDFIGVEAYRWDSADRKPEFLVLTLDATPEEPNGALYELDCLVPFVVPR